MAILLEEFLNSPSAFSKNSKTRCINNCKIDLYKSVSDKINIIYVPVLEN